MSDTTLHEELCDERDKLKAENTRLRDERDKADGAVANMTLQIADLRGMLAEAEQKNTPLREERDRLRARVTEQVESWERNAVAWRGKTSLAAADVYALCAGVLRYILGK
jgi:predicted nuclease with TOPRIM domain